MKETRRGFLKKAGTIGLAWLLINWLPGEGDGRFVDQRFGARFDVEPGLSFAEAEAIARRVASLYEKLPPYEQEISLAWLNYLIETFVPMLASVGVTNRPIMPEARVARFEGEEWESARARIEDCGKLMEFSDRWLDPADPWSTDPARAMAMVAHEIIHPQQGPSLCRAAAFSGSNLRLESSADIASMEVQAYAVYHGFPAGVFGLMARLRESSLSTALIVAAIEGEVVSGQSLVEDLARNTAEQWRLTKDFETAMLAVRASRGSHGRGVGEVRENLPMPLLVEGIRENDGVINGLILSSTVNGPQPFAVPHLMRFLREAEARVASA